MFPMHDVLLHLQGIDGTDGNQPRFTSVISNVAREIGHFEKQTSMYTQGKSCQNVIQGNGCGQYYSMIVILMDNVMLNKVFRSSSSFRNRH
jgi:hypothetical protein